EIYAVLSIFNNFKNDENIGTIPFPILISFLSSLDLDKQQEVQFYIESLKSKSDEYNTLLKDARKQLSNLSIEKYARIFGGQAAKHSRFFTKLSNERSNFNNLKLGAAEIWLILGLLSLSLLPTYLISNFTSEELYFQGTEFNLKFISWYSIRLVVISSWIYLTSLCFKHYNINKYLSTINSFRENVLNSFKLLSELIPKENVEARIELIKEITKSTYFAGKIPYVNEKNEQTSFGNILDILNIYKGK
ncbi:hypothetical protein, partial [Leptospira bourretii]